MKAFAVINTPTKAIWRNRAVIIDDDTTETDARIILMNEFARSILGTDFASVTSHEAFVLFTAAERNGYSLSISKVIVKDDVQQEAA